MSTIIPIPNDAVIKATALGVRLAKKKLFKTKAIVAATLAKLSEEEAAEWQKLENMAKENMTGYDQDKLLRFMEKAGLITISLKEA